LPELRKAAGSSVVCYIYGVQDPLLAEDDTSTGPVSNQIYFSGNLLETHHHFQRRLGCQG
jgi:hypothetical protein